MAKVRKRRPKPLTEPNQDPNSLHCWASRYLSWLLQQNYSARTEVHRRSLLGQFVKWCEARSLHRPEEITQPIIERYQRHLFHFRQQKTGRPLAFASQAGKLIAIKMFFKWLVRQHVILYNPAAELDLPKLPTSLPRQVFTVEDVEQIMNQTDVREPIGVRDRAILETFFSTGVRRTELANLLVFDVDPERKTVFVRHGKGDKQRVVPIGERALAWIRKYLDEVRPQLAVEPDDHVLFLSSEGTAMKLGRITLMCKQYVEASGIGKAGAAHALRHACGVAMLEGGSDIRWIQAQLGHSHLSSTQIYTQVSIQQLQAVHAMTHPTAKLQRVQVTDTKSEVTGVHTAVATAVKASREQERDALDAVLLQEPDADDAFEEQ